MNNMNIRLGSISDTEEISKVHKNSIQVLCKTEYSSENIEKWTAILQPEIYEKAITEKILIVAEEEKKISGFGILDIDNAELCALYIDPGHVRKGVAKALLHQLELLALEKAVTRLNTCSTLNAVGFYKHHDYIEDGKTFHRLPNGAELECIKMHKVLITYG